MTEVTEKNCGPEIENPKDIVKLALEKKCVVFATNYGQRFRIPAAFVQNWSIWHINRFRFFHYIPTPTATPNG